MRLNDTVGAWMSERLTTVGPDEPVARAFTLMMGKSIHHLPVVAGRRLVGILSDRDLIGRMSSALLRTGSSVQALFETPVGEIMTRGDLATIHHKGTVGEAARLMNARGVNALPVVEEEGGTIVGLITTHDLLRALAERPSGL